MTVGEPGRYCERKFAVMRPKVSVPPPAANPMITVTILPWNKAAPCASAIEQPMSKARTAPDIWRRLIDGNLCRAMTSVSHFFLFNRGLSRICGRDPLPADHGRDEIQSVLLRAAHGLDPGVGIAMGHGREVVR